MSTEERDPNALMRLAIAMIIMLMIVLMVSVGKDADQAPTPTVSSATVAVQPGAWDKIPTVCRVEGTPMAPECLGGLSDGERQAIQCPQEDGSPDGQPCVWIDPHTRDLYYVDSGEYR